MAFGRLTLVLVFVLAGCSAGFPASPPVGATSGLSPSAKSSAWTLVSSPNAPPTYGIYDDTLYGVGGSSPGDVWAVGNVCCYTHGSQEYDHPLTLHWNGSVWSTVAGAATAPEDTTLHGVSALSRSDAWAVGNAPYPNNQAVFEHWNGKIWNAVSSPYIYNNGEMNSVVALSKNNVWAAGEGNFAAVLEHWNGSSWSFVPAYTQGLTVLKSIAASGPNDIWAVGEFLDPIVGLFSEHYDGSKWTYFPAFDNFYAAAFNSVTVLSPKDAWAVGYEEPSQQSQVPQTLIEHWDGSKWSLVRSPNRDPKGSYTLNNTLFGMAARSANDIWGVGFWTAPNAGPIQSLFVHWKR